MRPEAVATFTQVFEYKGKRYEVLGMGSGKHPDTGEWYPVIIYRDEKKPGTQHTFVRKASDFHKKFKFIEARPFK